MQIFDPIHCFHIEVEQILIAYRQTTPQTLYVIVGEHPLVGSEKRYDIGEFMNFSVDFKKLGWLTDAQGQRIDNDCRTCVQEEYIDLVHGCGFMHVKRYVPDCSGERIFESVLYV